MATNPFAPMLAASADIAALRFPLFASPKIDGMRVSVREAGPVTRGGGLLPNEKLRAYLSAPALVGLDGELTFGDPVGADVVQQSIRAGMTRRGPPPERGMSFWVFDSFSEPKRPFAARYRAATRAVKAADLPLVHLVPQTRVKSLSGLEALETRILSLGFEGVVLRDPAAPYVFGRIPSRSQALLKIKRRELAMGEIVGIARKSARGIALLVRHADYAEPFEVPIYGREGRALSEAGGETLIGHRVRFTRLRGSWKRAPRSPLFAGVAV